MNEHTTPMIVVFPRGQLTVEDKDRMTEAGIIAVEADNPEQVHQLHLALPLVSTGLTGDAVVTAALRSITGGPGTDQGEMNRAAFRFVQHLSTALTGAAKEVK